MHEPDVVETLLEPFYCVMHGCRVVDAESAGSIRHALIATDDDDRRKVVHLRLQCQHRLGEGCALDGENERDDLRLGRGLGAGWPCGGTRGFEHGDAIVNTRTHRWQSR